MGGAVGLDGLLAVGGELGLPVALAGLLLGEGVLLVLVVVVVICAPGVSLPLPVARCLPLPMPCRLLWVVGLGGVGEGMRARGWPISLGHHGWGWDIPPDDSFMALHEDTAKLLRSRGLAVDVVDGRRAAAERMKSLEAIVVVCGEEMGEKLGSGSCVS